MFQPKSSRRAPRHLRMAIWDGLHWPQPNRSFRMMAGEDFTAGLARRLCGRCVIISWFTMPDVIRFPDTLYIVAVSAIRTPQSPARSQTSSETFVRARSSRLREHSRRDGSSPDYTSRRVKNSSNARPSCMFRPPFTSPGRHVNIHIFTRTPLERNYRPWLVD